MRLPAYTRSVKQILSRYSLLSTAQGTPRGAVWLFLLLLPPPRFPRRRDKEDACSASHRGKAGAQADCHIWSFASPSFLASPVTHVGYSIGDHSSSTPKVFPDFRKMVGIGADAETILFEPALVILNTFQSIVHHRVPIPPNPSQRSCTVEYVLVRIEYV